MADLYPSQPLSAYVKLKIAGSSTDTGITAGGYDWDAESYFEDAKAVNSSHVIIDFSWRKPGSGSGETSFNLTVFDETAIYIESLIANKSGTSTGLYVEYGWASNGHAVRAGTVQGSLSEYSLSFNGPSTELNIVGHMNSEVQLAEANTTEFAGKMYQGNPAKIVKQICAENGWYYDSESIADTKDVFEVGSSEVPKTYLQSGRTLRSFINEDLAQDAETPSGQSAFKFFVDQNGKAYFKPYTAMTPGEIQISIYDENGALSGSSYAGGGGSASAGGVVKEFTYYAGKENNEVISFTPNYTFSAGAGLDNYGASVNSETGETFAMTIAGTALSVQNGSDGIATMDGSRVLGLSMSSYTDLAQRAKNLWEGLASRQITATMEIMGDPVFQPMGVADNSSVRVTVLTKYGIPHHTSGVYNITGVEESVTGGLYITTLELMKISG